MIGGAVERAASRRARSCGRVLAVDGRRDFIMPSIVSLTRAGYSCAVVLPGAHVIEAARWMPWNVLLLGVHGSMDSTLSLLRKVRAVNSAPAVLMAWDPIDLPPAEAEALGVVEVLPHPADADSLVRSVEQAMASVRAA